MDWSPSAGPVVDPPTPGQEDPGGIPDPGLKIVVIDDDPTGSQTVQGCPLLLRWDADSLRRGLRHPSPLLFLLANTRALDPAAAAERVAELCAALGPALAEATAAGWCNRWLVVSRGDSTLRGHFPLETDQINAALGPFDATFLVPAFLPGGRTTAAGIHYLQGEPVHTTAFARDRLFGYGTSHLPAWVEQKTGGRLTAAQVQTVGLAELDAAAAGVTGLRELCGRLAQLEGNVHVAVDAEHPHQLEALGAAVRQLTAPAAAGAGRRPRRFLFQSAASLINGLVGLPARPPDPTGLAALRRRGSGGEPLPGLVMVGSHVPLADAQLEPLLADPACGGVELEVARLAQLLEGSAAPPTLAALQQASAERLQAVLARGRTPVLFTSRGELPCRSAADRRRLGLELAALMARLAADLAPRLGYVICKGGITSHTLLAEGLNLAAVELQGQVLPGLSLVLAPADGVGAALPVLTFPGNLGGVGTLAEAWRLMEETPGVSAL